MWFQYDKKIDFVTSRWPKITEQHRKNILGTSVCVAFFVDRAGGTSKPGPQLAAGNRSSVRETIPD